MTAFLDATWKSLLCALLLPLPLLGAERPVWKVGTFDASSNEFHTHDLNYADPKSDPVFIVGKSRDREWVRFQPGPANGIAGGRLHPFTLKFDLPSTPSGVYHLKIGILYETQRRSFLKLEVNGHSGLFYFHPKLDFHAGDWEGTFVPQTGIDTKTIDIPSAWLKQGGNQFVFTAMDDPAAPQTSLGPIAPGHTGLVYDAMEFTQDPQARYEDAKFSALIEPTIFYHKAAQGELEVVDVFASAGHWNKAGELEFEIAGQKLRKAWSTDQEFGEQRFTFDVQPWAGASEARVRAGGQAAQQNIEAAKKWTIAIIPHEHLDIGFTDYPAKVAELHAQSIDGAMELMRDTPEFRWTLDGSWVANQYLNSRSKEGRDLFIAHAKDGSIAIPPEISNQHTGNASWEALARSLYNHERLVREYGIPSTDAAQIVDVPSYTWGYASLLHDAGIKYFIAASNGWRAPATLIGRWNERSPFYWEGPDGGRVLMWYSRAYLQMHTVFGSPWQKEAVRDALPIFLQAYTRPDYRADTAILFGSQLENTTLAREQSTIVRELGKEYAWPRFEFATVHSAMDRLEREWKGEIPVVRGDFGPYWEDGYGSDAKHTALHRENQHRIATAEILGSAVHAIDPRVHPDRTMLDDAWFNELIYDEHTWTYVGATAQPENHQTDEQTALKGYRVLRANNDITESIQRGWAQLEALVRPKEASVAVFNSLGWQRSGVIETDIPEGMALVDAGTGAIVPTEVLWKGKGIDMPGFGARNVRVRFLAADVPPVGYRLYTLKPRKDQPEESAISGNEIENEYYRIALDTSTGAIASIFDKQSARELVDKTSSYRFGAYLYATGGDDYPQNSLYRFGSAFKPPRLTVHSTSGGRLVSVKKSALGIRVLMQSANINTPIVETEIFLPVAEKKIELRYHVRKDRVLTRESTYIAFPFAVNEPEFAYGSQTAWVNPAKDELPGGSREWYLPTTWAAVHNQATSMTIVPIDAPLVTFGDIVRGAWPAEFKPKNSTIFSWLMNNYWNTNFPAWQGGDFTFRYVIGSDAKFDPTALTKLAWSSLTPLERDDVAGSNDASRLPNSQASLLKVSDEHVQLLTWKLAEDGQGTILRLQESAGTGTDFSIGSAFVKVKRAWICDVLERNQKDLEVTGDELRLKIRPFQVLTVRLETQPRGNE